MKRSRFSKFFMVGMFLTFSVLGMKKIKIYLVGDSTMAKKEISAYPETGWGMPFAYFFDSTVVVDNRAQNGRSTRTFIEENRWKSVLDSLSSQDYVFIQFGHNDEVKTKKSYTTEGDFKSNLTRFVLDAKIKKAYPILITPVSRRSFDSTTGVLKGTHDTYSAIVREVAKEQSVPLIDLDVQSQDLLRKFGPEYSKLLFNQLEPNVHPNYPEGKKDNTHFNELGARLMAEIVLSNIKVLKLDLVERIAKPVLKK